MIKIKRIENKGFGEIEVKRFNLPYTFSSSCPSCGIESVIDLSDEYISYPLIGLNEIEFCCESVGCKMWVETFRLAVTVDQDGQG